MSSPASLVHHPYVTQRPDLCGGSPVVVDTKFPVRSIVHYVLREGMTPEELIREFPQLNLSKIYDALSYYYDHQHEIDQDLARNTESACRHGQ